MRYLLILAFSVTLFAQQNRPGAVGSVAGSESTEGEIFCNQISYNQANEMTTVRLKKYLLNDATVTAKADGNQVTDLVEENTPGKALSGKKVRFANGSASPRIGVPFSVVLLSKQLTEALVAKKPVQITFQPSNEMFDKSPRVLNYPPVAGSNCK